MTAPTQEIPALDVDLYAPALLEDSRDLFARIRAAGAVVRLPRHRLYAIGRYDDVRAALRDDEVFVSGKGVAANPVTNLLARDTTLMSDGETHDARRKVLMRSLGAKAIAELHDRIDEQATRVVDGLMSAGSFDAVRDFATPLPVAVVGDLVGVRREPGSLLRWAAAAFDGLGPVNRRALAAAPASLGLFLYTQRLRPAKVATGSWAASVFEAQRRGEVSAREAKSLVIDFVAPSIDTTILASAHLLWLLARHPEAWEAIRADDSLIPAAVNETVRLASPIRGFTRLLAREHELDGAALPRGARVVLLFAAANLDESRFPEPERFDLHRSHTAHLGFGNGPHTCVGLHLAKLEMQALLRAMVPRVRAIEVGEPTRLRNNTLQGFTRLPARFLR